MQVELLNVPVRPLQQTSRNTESVDDGRKQQAKDTADLEKSSSQDKSGVQPEEILSQIKSLTENGLYSVRFENRRETGEMVIRLVDMKTDEVIRELPPEEILAMKANFEKYRGNFVDTVR
ncbi:MAG: flagellar protein FlaG [Desulforhopalus sp.]